VHRAPGKVMGMSEQVAAFIEVTVLRVPASGTEVRSTSPPAPFLTLNPNKVCREFLDSIRLTDDWLTFHVNLV
jgi:hypothetical protein